MAVLRFWAGSLCVPYRAGVPQGLRCHWDTASDTTVPGSDPADPTLLPKPDIEALTV